jgi:hypothetical protein
MMAIQCEDWIYEFVLSPLARPTVHNAVGGVEESVSVQAPSAYGTSLFTRRTESERV